MKNIVTLAVAVLSLCAGTARAQSRRDTAWLVVRTPARDALVLVDGEPVTTSPSGRIEVTPGQHTVTAELRDGRYWDAIVEVRAGARREVRLGMPLVTSVRADHEDEERARAEAASRPRLSLRDRYPTRTLSPTWRIVGLGVTGAFATCLAIFALETQALSDDYQRNPTLENYDAGMRLKNVTQYVFFPATLASAVLTTIAFVLSTPSYESP